jgi:hypothetical protein
MDCSLAVPSNACYIPAKRNKVYTHRGFAYIDCPLGIRYAYKNAHPILQNPQATGFPGLLKEDRPRLSD